MARRRINLPVELENLLTDDWERVIGQAMLSAEDKEIVRLYIVEQLPQVDVAGELHMDRSTISRRMDKILTEARRTARMENADGSVGAHWTMEQTTAVAESMGIQASVVPRWAWGVTMNMMYSDYYDVAMEFGVNRPEFYAALAKAFLMDKDAPAPEEKLCEYYKHIASRG